MKIDWQKKLTSRKFWLSIATLVSMLLVYSGKSASEAEQVAAIIMAGATVIGYMIGEGLADSGTSYQVHGFNVTTDEEDVEEDIKKE